MYISFINLGGKCDIFFSTQFNNNSNKKNCPTHRFNSTQPNPTHVGWIRLDKCDGLSWVKFFLTHHDKLGQKISSTQSMHIHGSTQKIFFFIYSLWVCMGEER